MNSLIKKCFIYFACLLIMLKGAVINAAAAGSSGMGDYSDIKGHWAENTINKMVSEGLINGIPADGHFQIQPDKDITRAEFITVLYRSGKIPASSGNAKKFNDVAEDAWFKEALDRLAGSGLVKGYDDGTFKPGHPITRAEIASILCRSGEWETPENIDKLSALDPFNDLMKDQWYYNSVMISKLKGVIGGYPDGTFGPVNKASRAEAFSMIARFIEKMKTAGSGSGTGEASGNKGAAGSNTGEEPGGKSVVKPGNAGDSSGLIGYNIKGNAGEKVLYQVYGYGMKNLDKFDIKVCYDPSLIEAEGVVKGTLKKGDYLNTDISAADEGYIIIHGDSGIPADESGRGVVFVVIFKVKAGASGSARVTLTGAKRNLPGLYDCEGKLFENVEVNNGSITFK